MAETYAYRVRDRRGALLSGEIQADSRDLVLAKLREMEYIPLEVKRKSAGLKKEISLRPGRVKLKHLAVFSRQFATMVNSGLPLLRTLAILSDQTESKELARVVGEIRIEVERGSSLSDAMERYPKAFNALYVAMVRSGEISGTLDQVLLRVADTIEKEVSLRRKIKSAMTYPTVVFALVIIILTVMLVFVVPTFKNLYADLGGVLPAPTRLLIAISDTVRKFFPFVVGGIALSIWAFRQWLKTDRGRYAFDRFKLKLPVFGELFRKTALSRFARTLGTLSRSGVPILQALDIVHDTVKNAVVARAVKDVQTAVKEGESMTRPLARHSVFPPMVVQMMAVGEETGALDTMLGKVADFYDEEIEAAVESLTSLIEPVLIAVVGGVVGAIVICLYLPTFRIFELIE